SADGSPDTSFGTGGQTTIDIGAVGVIPTSMVGNSTTAVAMDGAGRIVLVGTLVGELYRDGSASHFFAVDRLSANGSLDTSFGSGGQTSLPFGGTAVAMDAAGGIVVAGPGGMTRLNGDGS